jgi:hypothetical protein
VRASVEGSSAAKRIVKPLRLLAVSFTRSQLLEDIFADRVYDTCSDYFVSSTASGKHMPYICNLRVILNSIRLLTSIRRNRYKMLYKEEFIELNRP